MIEINTGEDEDDNKRGQGKPQSNSTVGRPVACGCADGRISNNGVTTERTIERLEIIGQ